MYGGSILPAFGPWVKEHTGADMNYNDDTQPDMEVDTPKVNTDFLDELGTQNISRRSFLKWDRVIHSHGHTY